MSDININVLAGGVVAAQNANDGFYQLGTNVFGFDNLISGSSNGFFDVSTYSFFSDITLTVNSDVKLYLFGTYDQFGDQEYEHHFAFEPVATNVDMSGGQSDTLRALAAGQTYEVDFTYHYWYPDIIRKNYHFDGNNDVYETGLDGPYYVQAAFIFHGVNDAPMLADRNLALANIAEDAAAPTNNTLGTSVSSLTAGFSDYDTGVSSNHVTPLRGIAITGLDTTHGTWWYTTGYPSYTWVQISNVSEAHALCLRRVLSVTKTPAPRSISDRTPTSTDRSPPQSRFAHGM